MSIYQERMEKQTSDNQELYYAWIEKLRKNGQKNLDSYQSTVTGFLDSKVNDSIVNIKFIIISSYFEDFEETIPSPATKRNKVAYLKSFFEFVNDSKTVNWDFGLKDFDLFQPDQKELKKTEGREKPLSFEEFYDIGEFFNTHMNEKKMG